MTRAARVALGAAVAGTLVALLAWAFVEGRAEIDRERELERPIKVPPRTSRGPNGEPVIAIDRDAQARLGIEVAPLRAASLAPEVAAYGRLDVDPARTFTVRAPFAGTLRAAAWPSVGDAVPDGAAPGSIDPLLLPADVVALRAKLAEARADAAGARAEVAAARAAYERLRVLNADAKNVSDRALEEARAKLEVERARLGAAEETVRVVEAALAEEGRPAAAVPLVVERGGEVVEVAAQPGEAVEAGQPILRVARFDRLLATVEVPAGEPVLWPIAAARVVATGHEGRPLLAEPIGVAPAFDSATQGARFRLRVDPGGLPLRPGTAVVAHLVAPGAPRAGVIVPREALVRTDGAAWVYVEAGDGRFARREAVLERLVADGWFVSGGLLPEERVVVSGAEVLLSEELKARIEVEEEPE